MTYKRRRRPVCRTALSHRRQPGSLQALRKPRRRADLLQDRGIRRDTIRLQPNRYRLGLSLCLNSRMRRFASLAGDLRLCPSAHALSRGRSTTQSVPVGMHRICAAVCETARLAHWRRNLDSNSLVPHKQETLFRRASSTASGCKPPHCGPRGTEANLAPSPVSVANLTH
jgi:hypothetical protein